MSDTGTILCVDDDSTVLQALRSVLSTHFGADVELEFAESGEEALEIVARGAVKPMVEVFPKERVDEAYQRLLNGELRFKAVVTY